MKGAPKKKSRSMGQHRTAKKGGGTMYTDFGYTVDDVEFATLDEAYHRNDPDDDD